MSQVLPPVSSDGSGVAMDRDAGICFGGQMKFSDNPDNVPDILRGDRIVLQEDVEHALRRQPMHLYGIVDQFPLAIKADPAG